MTKEWTNWSGSLRFTPAQFLVPRDEEELCKIVKQTRLAGGTLRVAGAGHSSSPLVKTPETLINLAEFKGIEKIDADKGTATLRSGMTVHEANMALQKKGLALFNTGDVDVQMLAGAISTGTHGSGRKLQNLSSMLSGVRLVNSEGVVQEISQETHAPIMPALCVSLGSLGIFTAITVKVQPLFKLKRIEFFTDTDVCIHHFDQLADENRNVDFYWYPRRDEIKIRILNEPGQGTKKFAFEHRCMEQDEGFVGEILPRQRELKFDEMEYALPAESGMACFREIRKRIKDKHRRDVAWRVLYRTIAQDKNFISPHYGRDSVSISLHHNAGLPYEKYFNDIEPIFRSFGGRPHWGKKHSMVAEHLRRLYPEWDAFHRVRKEFDPEGCWMNPYLHELFESI